MNTSRAVIAVAAILFVSLGQLAFARGHFESAPAVIVGSGRVATEARSASGFTAVELAGSGRATVSIGGAYRVEVTTDDNLLPYVTTEVRSGKLVLGIRPGTVGMRYTKLEYSIVVPSLSALEDSGSGDINIVGRLSGDSLSASISGSGSIRGDVAVKSLDARIGGSGSLRFTGRADRQHLVISGSGSIDNRELRSGAATAEIMGSGDIWVRSDDESSVTIAGSGSFHYHGRTAPSVKILGSGRVTSF